MQKILFLTSLICLITIACTQSCGENEVFKTCGTCDGTCASPNPSCEPVCRRGCFCKESFVRDSQGKCIDIKTCPLKCGTNEVYNPCPEYCKLDDDCEFLLNNRTVDCFAPHSNFPCQPRCECIAGFVRIGNQCVSPDKCCKGENEVAVNCPVPCQETCTSVPSPDCTLTPCFKIGCLCRPGYVKNSIGICIPRENCETDINFAPRTVNVESPARTTPITIATTTQPPEISIPETTTQPPEISIPETTTAAPTPTAAPTNAATSNSICGENKVYTTCVPAYEATCLSSVTVPATFCKSGCICKPGFVRNGDDCISPDQCQTFRNRW